MKVRVAIDRLVFDGLAPGARDRERIRRSFEKELARLIRSGQPAAIRGGSIASIAAPAVRVNARSSGQTGESIARSVFQSMRGH